MGGTGIGGSPTATTEIGGQTFGAIAADAAQTLTSISHIIEKGASIASTIASYQRRQDDWDHQRDLAAKEIQQLTQSITAAELRVAIAEKELADHLAQIDNAKAIDAFMRTKYTNQELFQWQVGRSPRCTSPATSWPTTWSSARSAACASSSAGKTAASSASAIGTA